MASKPRAMPIIGIKRDMKKRNGGKRKGHCSMEVVKSIRNTNSVVGVTALLMF
jgi:hypothetical protein